MAVIPGAPSRTLLTHIAKGRVVPFVGAGFSLNAGPEYGDFHSLTQKLKSDVSDQYQHLTYPLDITDQYVKEHGEQELRDAICGLLPDSDSPNHCHTLLMQFPWIRIFTTNFDCLLESAIPEKTPVAVTNREYSEAFSRADKLLLVKLCGDRRHRDYIRATRARLSAEDMSRRSPLLYDDLLFHITRRPFFFLGYSLSDPFIRFVRQVVETTLAGGTDALEPKQWYMLTFDKSEEEVRSLQTREGLIAVNLETKGGDKKAAIIGMLEEAAGFLPSSRRAVAPGSRRGEPSHTATRRSETAWEIPVFATSTSRAPRFVTDTLPALLKEIGREHKHFKEDDFSTGDLAENGYDEMIGLATCVVFVYGKDCNHFDELAARAELLGCPPIILCTEEQFLSTQRASKKHVCTTHPMCGTYVLNEILLASTGDRLQLCEEQLRLGDTVACVTTAWICIEQYLEFAARKVLGENSGAPSKQAIVARLKKLKSAADGGFDYIDLDVAKELRDIRNQVVHKGLVPTKEGAEKTLAFTKNVLRSMGFDLPRFASKMDIFRGGMSGDGAGQ